MRNVYRLNPTGAAANVMDRTGIRILPQAGVLSAPAPRWLDSLARACWEAIVAEQVGLARVGLAWVTASDSTSIEILCVAYSRWRASVAALDVSIEERRRQATTMLEQQGLSHRYARSKARRLVSGTTLSSKSGDLIPSPFVNLELQQRKALSVALREAGFAPGVRLALLAKLARFEGSNPPAPTAPGTENDHLLD